MVPMHGFFLLLANLIHDKVSFSSSNIMGYLFLSLFGKNLLNNPVLGLQKDTGDARAFSFLHILELLPFLLKPPNMIFIENVVGFEVCLV